jgi:hypothetical protein
LIWKVKHATFCIDKGLYSLLNGALYFYTISMSRIFLVLASLLLLAGTAHAQLGVKVGVNFATLATEQRGEDRKASSDGQLGYQVGVFYEKQLTPRLSLLSEVQYSRQRMNLHVEDYSISDGGYASDYALQLHYLNVPILARIYLGKFYVEAGPQGSFQLAAHEKGSETIGTIAGSFDRGFNRPATDSYRRFDMGLCVGAGVKLPAGFALGMRAAAGFISLTEFGKTASNFRGDLKNQVVHASLSYQFMPRS